MTSRADVEQAEAHWQFLEKQFHKIFVAAFLHGKKHGKAELLKE